MSITLTRKQEEGLRTAVERYRMGEKYTVIAGYAGSGKSTLVKFIVEALNLDPKEDVAYIAFTGKAATVLQQKGCPNAVTAHKLLYKAKPLPNGSYKFYPRDVLEQDYKVIIVDEVSMLPRQLWEQLLRHHVYILAMGDPFQLPAINPDDDNRVLEKPHVFLDEIMRQAQDSEIIRFSMWIREGKPLAQYPCVGEQVQVLNKGDLVSGMYEWADQIICSTNRKRIEINNYMRQLKGFGPEPEIGDKIISLRNHWDWSSDQGTWALTNGSIGTIEYFDTQQIWVPRYIYNGGPIPYMFTNMVLDDGEKFNYVPVDYTCLTTGEPLLDSKQTYRLNQNKELLEAPFEFSYAYAITCHKAQGSQWPKVMVFEEWFPNESLEHARWLYTAGTRPEEKLLVIKK